MHEHFSCGELENSTSALKTQKGYFCFSLTESFSLKRDENFIISWEDMRPLVSREDVFNKTLTILTSLLQRNHLSWWFVFDEQISSYKKKNKKMKQTHGDQEEEMT